MISSFFTISALSTLVIAFTSLIAYEILGLVWSVPPRLTFSRRLRMLFIMLPIFAAHIICVWMYAGVYFCVENFTAFGYLTGRIAPAALTYESFIERVNYSKSTYASLGMGDIAPNKELVC